MFYYNILSCQYKIVISQFKLIYKNEKRNKYNIIFLSRFKYIRNLFNVFPNSISIKVLVNKKISFKQLAINILTIWYKSNAEYYHNH